jgi:multidrug efflux pump
LPVASAFLQAAQDLRIGGRGGNALYQYTIQADNVQDLRNGGRSAGRDEASCPAFRM